MVNNVIGVVNYVIAARPSLLNFMIADMVGFGAAAGAVTAWVTAGAAAGAFTEPHAARPRPAASASAGIATTLLSFIVLPPVQKSLISLSANMRIRSVHPYA
jgi:hypothetical protein